MKTADLYKKKEECCGCESCSNSCPKGLIKMCEDEEGFLYPVVIGEESCIHCNRCISNCPMKTPGRTPLSIISSYGGYVKSEEDLRRSASGGYATAISEVFIREGGVVYGVRYTEDFMDVKYSRATSLEDLELFRTSKYVQAQKNGVYSMVQKDLKKGLKVLFIGLPCDISALYHVVGDKDKLFTISLICHGPTSSKVHREYCRLLKDNFRSDEITFFSMRYKNTGWKPYYIRADFSNGNQFLEQFKKTEYEIAFKFLKRPSCSECPYKLNNKQFGLISDIILGDFHAANMQSIHYNAWGVSQMSIMTPKGHNLMEMIKPICLLEPIPYNIIETKNLALTNAISKRKNRRLFLKFFVEKGLAVACKEPHVIAELRRQQFKKSFLSFLAKIRSTLLKK